MANHYRQLSLKDIFSDCKDMFWDNVPSFFQLLEQYFDISLFIPQTFYNAFYQRLGRKRDYPLTGFLSSLVLQKIFSIPTDSLLIFLLSLCKELCDFCGFTKVPDAPLSSRFKLGFADQIKLMFQQMVTIRNLSASRLIPLWLKFLPSTPPALSFSLRKTIPKLSMHLSVNLRLITRIILTLTPIRWLTGLCLHWLLPALILNSNISIGISDMPINLPYLPTDWKS